VKKNISEKKKRHCAEGEMVYLIAQVSVNKANRG
jgi:hypothetical protein